MNNARINLLKTKEKLSNVLLNKRYIGTELQIETLFNTLEDLQMCIGVDQFGNLYKVNIELLCDYDAYPLLDIKEYCKEESFTEILENALYFLEIDKEDLFDNKSEEELNNVFNNINILNEWLCEKKGLKLKYVSSLFINDKLVQESYFDNIEDCLIKSEGLEELLKNKYIVTKEYIDFNSNLENILYFINNPKIKVLKNNINTYKICNYSIISEEEYADNI